MFFDGSGIHIHVFVHLCQRFTYDRMVNKFMYKRALTIRDNETFFLWGPRLSGKTTYLTQRFPRAYNVNLLESDLYHKYSTSPYLLRQEVREWMSKNKSQNFIVVIDEIQKIPALLDEVHLLIEADKIVFGLCGSSARKVKRGHANLLGGRAIRYELSSLVSAELGKDFDIVRACNNGCLPLAFSFGDPKRFFRSYVGDYLKEEIAAEGLVRKLSPFSEFLNIAAITDTEIVNFSNIANDCRVSKSTAQEYFQILEDTLIGSFLPAYTKRPKRRTIQSPRFYFFDVGIVNYLAKRHMLEPGSELFGKAFENFIHHELKTYNAYSEKYFDLSYWRLSTGVEVDFVINDMEVVIEVKSSKNIISRHLNGLREAAKDFAVKKKIVVSLEQKSRVTEDGIRILSIKDFLQELWAGEIL